VRIGYGTSLIWTLSNHPLFHLPAKGQIFGRNISEVTRYKTIWKIIVYILLVLLYTTIWYLLCRQQPFSSPYPDAYQSTPFHPVCLRSILILYRYPSLGLPWGLCPFSFSTKTLRAFPFCVVHATYQTHLIHLDLICVWIDLAQDEDSLRAVVNVVMDFRAALNATNFLINWSTLCELVIAYDHSC
jgi:hypothetical protein